MTAPASVSVTPALAWRREDGRGRTIVLDLSICAVMAVSSVGLLLLVF